MQIDTKQLPVGSVILDGGTNGLPPGHVSIKAKPEEIKSAIINSGKYPKKQ